MTERPLWPFTESCKGQNRREVRLLSRCSCRALIPYRFIRWIYGKWDLSWTYWTCWSLRKTGEVPKTWRTPWSCGKDRAQRACSVI